MNESSIEMAGKNPDFATEDLYRAIEKGDFPKWDLYVQIATEEQLAKLPFDPFDVTKVWYHKDFPMIKIGEMTLNRNPKNYFAEVEQSAFSPARFIPGIGPSPDKMLQARLFAYEDAHRYRLGINYQQIPVNQPKNAKTYSTQRDGYMSVNGNYEDMPNYFPSSLKKAAVIDQNIVKPPQININTRKGRFEYPLEDVDFVQPGLLFDKVLDHESKKRLIENTAFSLEHADIQIQYRWSAICYKASKMYGTMLANRLKLDLKRVVALAQMTPSQRNENTIPTTV